MKKYEDIEVEYLNWIPFMGGFFDPDKQCFAIEPRFQSVRPFQAEGYALIYEDGCWGAIDTKGQIVVSPKVQGELQEFFPEHGLVNIDRVVDNQKRESGYLNFKGEEVIPMKQQWAYSSTISKNGLIWATDRTGLSAKDRSIFGFINTRGAWQIAPQFTSVSDFSFNGLAAVRMDNDWGYIDANGTTVIPFEYQYAYPFMFNGLATVCKDDKWGMINALGEVVIPIEYLELGVFKQDATQLAYFKIRNALCEERYGYLDAQGKRVIQPKFECADHFYAERAAVKVEDKYGFIDPCGELVIPAVFDMAYGFYAGDHFLCEVCDQDEKPGVINVFGEVVLEQSFYDHVYLGAGLKKFARHVIVKKDEKEGVCNTLGEWVIPMEFNEISIYQNRYILCTRFTDLYDEVGLHCLFDIRGVSIAYEEQNGSKRLVKNAQGDVIFNQPTPRKLGVIEYSRDKIKWLMSRYRPT